MTPYQRTPGESAERVGQAPAPPGSSNEKEEEERKGAGLPWYAGSGGLLEPGAATIPGELGAPPSGLFGTGKIAAALAAFFGGPGTFLGGLFGSSMGPSLILGGILAWAGLMGVAAVSLMGRGGSDGGGAASFPSLGAVGPSGIVIGSPRNKSLDYLGRANQGELSWDEEHPLAPKDGEKPPEAKKDAPASGPAAPVAGMPDISALAKAAQAGGGKGFADAFGKLTSGSGFGGGGGGGALAQGKPQLAGNGFELKKTFAPAGTGSKLNGFTGPRGMRSVDGAKGSANNSQSGMGQLKFAKNMSGTAYGAADSAARQAAGDAFEQSKTSGGGDPSKALGVTDSGSGDGIVPAGTGGAPDMTSGSSVPTDAGTATTPYQNALDQAKQNGDNAGQYKTMGIALIVVGAGLIAAGIALLFSATLTAAIVAMAIMLIAAGAAAIIGGIGMMKMGQQQADQAKQAGDQISNGNGQADQGKIVSDCAQQAYDSGQSVDQVCGNNGANNGVVKNSTVHQDTTKESNAN
jgi:hypothetical protein